MEPATRCKVLWAIWMTAGGVLTAVVVYVLTSSLAWALVGLLGSGVVLNAIGQIVTQPVNAIRGGPVLEAAHRGGRAEARWSRRPLKRP